MSAALPPDTGVSVAITLTFEIPTEGWAAAHGLDPADPADVAQHVAGYFFVAVIGGRISAALGGALPEWQRAGGTVRVTDGAVTTGGQPPPGEQPPSGGDRATTPQAALLPIPLPLLLPVQRAAPDAVTGDGWPPLWWEHEPIRPTWRCRVCSQVWPCRTRREQLRAAVLEGGGVGVGLLLDHCLIQAVKDQPGRCPGCLGDQLLGWTSPDPTTGSEQSATRSVPDGPAALGFTTGRPPHRIDCPHATGSDSHDD